jgi:hypothetical protein
VKNVTKTIIFVLISTAMGLAETPKQLNDETKDYYGYDLNNLNVAQEFGLLQGAQTEESVTYGAAIVPDTMPVYQFNAVAGFVVNDAPKVNVVGGYFQARSNASNTHTWGINPVCALTAGLVDQICTGEEIDVNASNASDNVAGLAVMGYWTGQPTASPTGIEVAAPNGPNGTRPYQWAQSFFSLPGAAYYAFVAGYTEVSGDSLPSQPVAYLSVTPSGTSSLSREYADWNGNAVWHMNRTSAAIVQPGVGPCGQANQGSMQVVIDATGPLTYMGPYLSGGNITAQVICSYNGRIFAWLTH